VTAIDAEEAIGCLKSADSLAAHPHPARFDLLITDYAIPGMNGVQLAAAVRDMRAGHPVILVTGSPLAV
jgi:CheY-like chemotaxis protein